MHHYEASVEWTGNQGEGTSSYRTYSRSHEVSAPGKPAIAGSSDPAFRGDPKRWSPEDLLVASLSQCHMLWFLHLASTKGVMVTSYVDNASGTMVTDDDGGGRFTEVSLHPQVTVATPETVDLATSLHDEAHRLCFIANSVNFPVACEPTTRN
jgi:organic hydroperoxide reductase OsmC/OhrA